MPTTLAPSRTQVLTPGGHTAAFETRPGTSDGALVSGILAEDEYRLRDLPPLTGWAIDIGAHIGIVSVALALDHPDLSIVAVEALPENVEVLRANVALNGLDGRVFVEEAAAAADWEYDVGRKVPITYGWSSAPNQPDDYMSDNRFIGGMVGPNETSRTIECAALSLDEIFAKYSIRMVDLLKIDCEGCEWLVLNSTSIYRCQRIWGELHHGKHGGAAEFRALLGPRFDVEMDDAKVVSLFRAERRYQNIIQPSNAWPG